MTNKDKTTPSADSLHVLLADDDGDDRYFFKKVIDEMSIAVKLTTVVNGEELLLYLNAKPKNPTDILFLDLNMPKKNGSECLVEIKNNPKLKRLPIVIYSTSLSQNVADFLYEQGAYFYIHKTDTAELRKVLHHILLNLSKHKLDRPKREEFVIQKFL
ncbi:MAG TPA: response regulator [Chryseolinea sp.]